MLIAGGNGHALVAGVSRGSPRAGEELKNRMREIFTSGTVGGAGGNPGSYPEPVVGRSDTECD